jgi:hypothetical protein
MTRRTNHIIDDPLRPFRLKVGIAYRVVEENGELVVRGIGAAGKAKKPWPENAICASDRRGTPTIQISHWPSSSKSSPLDRN